MKNLITTIVLMVIVTLNVSAQITNAVNGTGNDYWEENDTWDNYVPSCGLHENIVIDGIEVIIESNVDLSACDVTITIINNGELTFANNTFNSSLALSENSVIYVESGGKITSANAQSTYSIIQIGDKTVWDSNEPDIDAPVTVDRDWASPGFLPIELLSFEAKQKNENCIVEWTTATELNNEYFTIEKSIDGINFEEIGTVNGVGNSIEEQSYSFVDENPTKGVAYYRLKQTDFDGKSETFSMVAVESLNIVDFSPYPNPTQNTVTIDGEINIDEIIVTDIQGKNVNSNVVITKNSNSTTIDLTSLPIGMYVVRTINKSAIVIKE